MRRQLVLLSGFLGLALGCGPAQAVCIQLATATPEVLRDFRPMVVELQGFQVQVQNVTQCTARAVARVDVADRGAGNPSGSGHRFHAMLLLTQQVPGAPPSPGTRLMLWGPDAEQVAVRAATRIGELVTGAPKPGSSGGGGGH